jgi:4-amino-4-deoxychorismate lyase
MTPDLWLINGESGGSVSVMDRGLNYADGLFETIAVRNGEARFLDYHLDRLNSSCKRLDMPLAPADVLTHEVKQLMAGQKFATIKILLTRGVAQRGYAVPPKLQPTRIVCLFAGDAPDSQPYRAGIEARWCHASVSANRDLAGMKTLGRLEQVMARSEWTQSNIREGLMTTDDGMVIGGTMSNVFCVIKGQLHTPDLSRCGVNGIMRRVIIEQAAKIDLGCEVRELRRGDVDAAGELFVSNSLIGIWPVTQLADRTWPIGRVTSRLMARLADAGVSECAS